MTKFWVLVAIFSILGYFMLGAPGIFIGFLIGVFLHIRTQD